MRKRRANPEAAIQRAVFQHIAARAVQGVFAFHPANGGYRKPIEAAVMKGQGVKPGVPDIIALHAGKFFALELKAPGGRPTELQLECIAQINEQGGFAAWTDSLDRALAMLECWGLLRPNRSGVESPA